MAKPDATGRARPERRGKADCRADTRGGGWAGIPHAVLSSEAYRTRSLLERAILVEIVGRMNGYNNGIIALSYADLARRLNRKNQAPFAKAIAALCECGLIAPGEDYFWKERKAREYRLTFVNTVGQGGRSVAATNDYLKWAPRVKNIATDAVAGKGKSATTFVAERIAAATDVVAGGNGKPPKTITRAATDVVVLIDSHTQGAGSEEKQDEKEGNSASGPIAADADTAEQALRGKITGHWTKLKRPARIAWAAAHGLTLDELKAYIIGGAHIPFAKLVALHSATKVSGGKVPNSDPAKRAAA